MRTNRGYWNIPKTLPKGIAPSFNDVAHPVIRPLSLQDLRNTILVHNAASINNVARS
jgi:hypothetical protein